MQIPTAIASFFALVSTVYMYLTDAFLSDYKWYLLGVGIGLPLANIAAVVLTYEAVQFKFKYYYLNFSKCFDKSGAIIDCGNLSNPP